MPEPALTLLVGTSALTLATAKAMVDTVRQFVDHPDHVLVTSLTDGAKVNLHLIVAPEDLGKVIGRSGRTARSLRILLGAISAKTGVHFELNIQAEAT